MIVFGTGDKSIIGEITSDTLNKILFNKDTKGQQLKDGDEVLYYHHRLEYGKEGNYFGIMFQKEYDQTAAIKKLKVAGFDVEVEGQNVKIKLGDRPIEDLENYLNALEGKELDKKVAGQEKIIEEASQKAPVTIGNFYHIYTPDLNSLYPGMSTQGDLRRTGFPGYHYYVGFETKEMAQKFSEDLLKYCGLGSGGKSKEPKTVNQFGQLLNSSNESWGLAIKYQYTTDGVHATDELIGLTPENMKALMEGRQKELKTELSKQLAALAKKSTSADDFAGKVWVNVMQELEAPKTVMERGFIKKTQPLLDEEKKAIESDVKAKAEAAYNEAKDIKEGDKAKLGIFGKLVDWLREKLGSDKSLQAKFMLNLSEKLAEKLGEKAEGQDKSHLDKILEERAAKEAAKSSIKL